MKSKIRRNKNLSSRRKLHHERGKRRQDCQYPRRQQVAFVRENDLFLATDPKCFYDWDRRFKSLSSKACRTLDSGKAIEAITAATDARFLTTASVSRGACGGFGTARNTAAAFHVFY